MPRHALDAQHYLSTETFSQEQKNLFGKLWTFVGFTSMVQQQNQFFSRKVAGVPIFVQRTEAGIRAFVNECPHRLSAIQTDATGKRAMVCPYHAWSFGAEGELRGMPNQGLYQFTPPEREKICLKKLHILEVGQLLFINFDSEPMPISQQFSEEHLQVLRDVSSRLDTHIIYSCHPVRYNWKLNMENVKDYNHLQFVHPTTFSPMLEKNTRHTQPIEPGGVSVVVELLKSREAPSLSSLSYSTVGPLKPHTNWFSHLCDTPGDDNNYYNWFLYPNVNFCGVRGEHFLFQQYDPVSPGVTDYHLWMMTAKRKSVQTDFTALLSTLMRGERKVIAEDTVILEKLQDGLGSHSGRFMHGDYEAHIVQQHLWYRDNILKAHA
ncbi:Rieske 2Fe-2S domain-containing protein [Pseudomonas sp. CDFA 602]|uniref:aromatic ring-hydroxylating oxygenase subunit alpha n=1 Tax=Pseudomonas californiensis TaxID=2829823 RepID=UPI001E530E18|nr:SRPBCC family protein [Pseudomonas californiensis]MCD5996852.1 Rieske 2Fe-2S domain-containing protein [Pseudomonas californiensis]MCD5998327.1 Rieske 2Fe-2S domain-containing protein [Pseudomonas californiensis]